MKKDLKEKKEKKSSTACSSSDAAIKDAFVFCFLFFKKIQNIKLKRSSILDAMLHGLRGGGRDSVKKETKQTKLSRRHYKYPLKKSGCPQSMLDVGERIATD